MYTEFEDQINVMYCEFWAHVGKLKYEAKLRQRRRLKLLAILAVLFIASTILL